MPDEHKEVEVILGPYRGQRMTMTTADAEAAVNDHWAIDPFKEAEPGGQHTEGEPLTEEERTHAVEAANTWAKAQWDKAAGIEPPPPEGGEGTTTETMRRRSLKPDPDDTSGYKTRGR